MENSSIEEPCSDTDKRPPRPRPTPLSRHESLQRMGSGASVVIDPESGGTEAESRKLPSSQYKGVVPQPNGRWGAQIYEKHQRVWLGTFNEQAEAARAYDVAVQRFRGRDAVTNFKPLEPESSDDDAVELAFISSHSKAEVVDMLRKHTYHEELQQSRRSFCGTDKRSTNAITDLSSTGSGDLGSALAPPQREQLFDKAVTPSDVGKLNRLVIPKQHAEKYFPLQHIDGAACKGVLLSFEERCGKVWRFRYSYWNSSQSYVLTKGWSRFVKEKGLKTGDVVAFQRSVAPEKKLFIDWKRRTVPAEVRTPSASPLTVEVVRLFGVNIVKVPTPPVTAELDVNGGVVGWVQRKRCRDHVEHFTTRKHCKEASS